MGCQLDPSRGCGSAFIVLICRHCCILGFLTLVQTWHAAQTVLSGRHTKCSAGFGRGYVQDSGEERWTRKGLFATCSRKQCLCQQRRCCFYFSPVYADSLPLPASVLYDGGVSLASQVKLLQRKRGCPRMRLCSLAQSTHHTWERKRPPGEVGQEGQWCDVQPCKATLLGEEEWDT